MPRPPDGPTPRDKRLTLRMTESTEQALDRQRGPASRSEYLRRLIIQDGRRERRSPKADS